MNFIGNDKQFVHRMEEWSELMNQLTKHMTDEEKRALVIDPGKLSSFFFHIFSFAKYLHNICSYEHDISITEYMTGYIIANWTWLDKLSMRNCP